MRYGNEYNESMSVTVKSTHVIRGAFRSFVWITFIMLTINLVICKIRASKNNTKIDKNVFISLIIGIGVSLLLVPLTFIRCFCFPTEDEQTRIVSNTLTIGLIEVLLSFFIQYKISKKSKV